MDSASYPQHRHTPQVTGTDPRGLKVRSVEYLHRDMGPSAALVTRRAFDAQGLPTLAWDPRLWERAGTDAAFSNTRDLHTKSGFLVRRDSNDAGWRVVLHDCKRAVVGSWFAGGERQTCHYDSLGRLISRADTTTTGEHRFTERYSWAGATDVANQRGRITRIDDTASTLIIGDYDIQGHRSNEATQFLKSTDLPDWPDIISGRESLVNSDACFTQYQRTATGQLKSLTDALGHVRNISYDISGAVSGEFFTPTGENSRPVVVEHEYNACGDLYRQRLANATEITRTMDIAAWRLQSITLSRVESRALIHELSYQYDAAGNVVGERSGPLSGSTCSYEHDSLSRLVSAMGMEANNALDGPMPPNWESMGTATKVPYTETYAYDDAGNLIELIHDGAISFTHLTDVSEQSNRSVPAKRGGPTPDDAYDENGQLNALESGLMLRWNARRRLIGVGPENTGENYTYYANGRRARKTSGDEDTRYLPALTWHNTSANPAGWRSIEAITTTMQAISVDSDKETHEAMALRYSLTDRLGSDILDLDENGVPIAREWYRPWGSTAGREAASSAEADYLLKRYGGKERDASGFYDYGFRSYAPWRQRWANPDPSELSGLNRFAMAGLNPTTLIDVDGLMEENPTRPRTLAFDRSSHQNVHDGNSFDITSPTDGELNRLFVGDRRPGSRTPSPHFENLPEGASARQVASPSWHWASGANATVELVAAIVASHAQGAVLTAGAGDTAGHAVNGATHGLVRGLLSPLVPQIERGDITNARHARVTGLVFVAESLLNAAAAGLGSAYPSAATELGVIGITIAGGLGTVVEGFFSDRQARYGILNPHNERWGLSWQAAVDAGRGVALDTFVDGFTRALANNGIALAQGLLPGGHHISMAAVTSPSYVLAEILRAGGRLMVASRATIGFHLTSYTRQPFGHAGRANLVSFDVSFEAIEQEQRARQSASNQVNQLWASVIGDFFSPARRATSTRPRPSVIPVGEPPDVPLVAIRNLASPLGGGVPEGSGNQTTPHRPGRPPPQRPLSNSFPRSIRYERGRNGPSKH